MLNYFMTTYGTKIIGIILIAVFGCLGYAVKRLCARYINDDTKTAIARTVVQFVEQVYTNLHGKDKLHKALEIAETLLKKKGIPFDVEEMEVLIEAAVAEFNEVFKAPLLDEATADAVKRTDDETTNSAASAIGFEIPTLE